MIRSSVTVLVLFCSVTACLPGYIAPAPAPVRAETKVAAPFDSTWSAVVGFFAERNIPIRTIEKASGIIVAEQARADNLVNRTPFRDKKGRIVYQYGKPVPAEGPALVAECGTYQRELLDPVTALYNVRVTGDAQSSAFRVNAKFSTRLKPLSVELLECSSVGSWERGMEETLLQRLSAAGTGQGR